MSLRIRDLIFSSWEGIEFVMSNPQMTSFDAPRQFFWPWSNDEFETMNLAIRSGDIALKALTFELKANLPRKVIKKTAALGLKKFKIICHDSGSLFEFLRQLKALDNTATTVDILLTKEAANHSKNIRKMTKKLIGEHQTLERVYFSSWGRRVNLTNDTQRIQAYEPLTGNSHADTNQRWFEPV